MTKTLSNASAKTDSNTSGCICSINETKLFNDFVLLFGITNRILYDQDREF